MPREEESITSHILRQEKWTFMSNETDLNADRNRTVARELRCLALKQISLALRREAQLLAVAASFERFADQTVASSA
jgi:hypothetical protein